MEWALAYDDALAAAAVGGAPSDTNGTAKPSGAHVEGGLCEVAFHKALSQCSQLRAAQTSALWHGFLQGSNSATMDLKTFCWIAKAVADGSEAVAELADLEGEDFEALGLVAEPSPKEDMAA